MNERTGLGSCNVCGGSGWVCEGHPGRPREHDDCGAATPCVCNPKAVVKWTKVLAEAQRNTEARKSRPDAPD
jgi:hypothetical protein